MEQSPNPQKRPEIYQRVVEEIGRYRSKFGYQPQWFSRIENKVNVPVKNISSVLVKDVCWRFPKVGNVTYDLYELDKRNRTVTPNEPEKIREHAHVLFDLINYRWTQKLEETDGSPRISKKIRGVERDKTPKRGNLKLFHKFLDIENPKKVCFLTGEKIIGTTSVDHIIPWSYMYSDDLWNLVYVKPEENSSKSNRLPTEDLINKLNLRNKRLLKILINKEIKSKHLEELKISIERDYVKKYWTGFKG